MSDSGFHFSVLNVGWESSSLHHHIFLSICFNVWAWISFFFFTTDASWRNPRWLHLCNFKGFDHYHTNISWKWGKTNIFHLIVPLSLIWRTTENKTVEWYGQTHSSVSVFRNRGLEDSAYSASEFLSPGRPSLFLCMFLIRRQLCIHPHFL